MIIVERGHVRIACIFSFNCYFNLFSTDIPQQQKLFTSTKIY